MTNKLHRYIFVSLLTVVLAAAGITALHAASEPQSFSGRYDWSDGGRDDLRIEFEPKGDGAWSVTFRFRFDGRSNTWKGTAQGSLDDGSELTGTARWRSRRWSWKATIDDGVMSGTHTELRSRGRTYETGTFVVSR